MALIELNKRQEEILRIVKVDGPITGEQIAEQLSLTRATLRPDLAILTMAGLVDARPRVGYYYSGKSTKTVLVEQMSKVLVGDVDSLPIVVHEKNSAYDAVVTMFTEDVGTLFVVSEGGILEGCISRKDLLKVTMGGMDVRNIPVDMVMTRMPNIVMTTQDEPVLQAAQKLILHQVDALPVVKPTADGNQWEVVGRFTKTNITKFLVDLVQA